VPVARTHSTIGSVFVTQNAYPREALTEAILRFVEEELEQLPQSTAPDLRQTTSEGVL
jgi:hypothetical protein